MPPERPKPRYLVLWVPAVMAGMLALGLAVWGATHQTAQDEPVTGTSVPSTQSSTPTTAEPEPSGSATGGPTGGPTGEPVDAKSALRRALAGWRDADTGTFTQKSVIPGIGRLRVTGVYELSTRSSEATQVFDAEDADPVEIRYAGAEGDSYLTSPDWGPRLGPCWMRFDDRALAESTAVALFNGSDSLPANVVALAHARATRVDPVSPDVVLGTVRLSDAVYLFGSGLVGTLGEGRLDEPVAAKFRLSDGELVGWRITGRSVVAALREADLPDRPGGVLLAAFSSYAVDVEYDDVGETEVDVRLPAEELRMTQAQARSGEACPAAR